MQPHDYTFLGLEHARPLLGAVRQACVHASHLCLGMRNARGRILCCSSQITAPYNIQGPLLPRHRPIPDLLTSVCVFVSCRTGQFAEWTNPRTIQHEVIVGRASASDHSTDLQLTLHLMFSR
ncbi:hypothetical protein PoB_005972300 [Plakobranchus ocellatus]|uniref:Uncharacterized protein n=1 Tax=Plakobranchus ocellatus TaxID=259542 RepID=A0AAV4CM13_9GAST|nr:hypothetical protein PoB_005972300 [Plakobranchus ocellatus]